MASKPICTRCGAVVGERSLTLWVESGLAWLYRRVVICEHCQPGLEGFLQELSPDLTKTA